MPTTLPPEILPILTRVTYEHGRFLVSDTLRMPQSARDAIDKWIVATGHPLGYLPGTQVDRIVALAREIVARQSR